MKRFFFIYLPLLALGCQPKHEQLRQEIVALLATQEGEYAVAFKDISEGEQILINEKIVFHAASTMKTPVMIELFKQESEGKISLTDSLLIKNEFKSIVDSSLYSLTPGDDSEPMIYTQIGKKATINDIIYPMITSSSNLATNILIEFADAKSVMKTMRDLGANDIQVLRGVEDSKAFKNGLNNSTTAYDLMIIFEKLAEGKVVSPAASKAMIDILLEQKYNDIIPAKLPKDARVAHKTGWLTGLNHDSGIVFMPNGKSYVLVLLSRNVKDEQKSKEMMAEVSRKIYEYEELGRK